MSFRSGFFNSKNHDKQYYASDVSKLFDSLINPGIFGNVGNKFIARPGEGMQVIIPSGMAWFNSTWTLNDSDVVINIDEAPYVANYSRIDGIFLQIFPVNDMTTRENGAYYMKGTETSATPSKPVPTATDGELYIPLCYVTVVNGVTAITASMIENCVGVTTTTPFVTGILETVEISELLTQWEAQWNDWLNTEKTDFEAWATDRQTYFTEWFEHLQYVLDGDVAGHLQNEIDALQNQLGVFYDSVEDAEDDLENIPDGTMVYTPDPTPDIQDEIDRLTTVHFIDSQIGSGSKNITLYTASTKRLLIVTKKSGIVVGTKEIPTNVLESGDKIVLGDTAHVIYDTRDDDASYLPSTFPVSKAYNGKRAGLTQYHYYQGNASSFASSSNVQIADRTTVFMSASAELSDGATLTFNGNNSFTLAVTDSSLSVYLYADMVVLGGSASAMNVAIDLTDTDMSSTNVEDAIKELHDKTLHFSEIKSTGTFALTSVGSNAVKTITFELDKAPTEVHYIQAGNQWVYQVTDETRIAINDKTVTVTITCGCLVSSNYCSASGYLIYR